MNLKIKNIFLLSATLLAICFSSIPTFVNAQAFIDLESGVVSTGYNNVRIPGNEGILFSLKNDLDAKQNAFIRLRAGYTIKSRHTIFLLYAPLVVKSEGTTDKQIDFEGVIFPADEMINASYKFNSYRLTYRYDIVKKSNIEFGLGFTAKIRDAEIALNSQKLATSKTNVGFVPIVNFRLCWKINDQFGMLFEGDALAAPQGRAEDVLLAGTYSFSKKITMRLGYRILEGGANNNEVYNFSLFHYASFGVSYIL
jgi:hypothetical protein